MKLKYFLDSGANIHSRYSGEVSLEELGHTLESWQALLEEEREAEVKELAFERSEWGYELVEDDES